MNNRVYGVFAAIIDNNIIVIDFNLKDFYKQFVNKWSCFDMNYQALYRRFKKSDAFEMELSGVVIHLQCIILKPQAKRKKEIKPRTYK